MEGDLWRAVENDEVEDVKGLLADHPGLDINWKSEAEQTTALHRACANGNEVLVGLLLRHPSIEVNVKKTYSRETPFLLACAEGRTSCFLELLRDARVQLNTPDKDGYTPLSLLAAAGSLEMIKWWIASGRDLEQTGKPNSNADAGAQAKKAGKAAVVSLLKAFKDDPVKVRKEVRKELGIAGESD